MAKYIQNDLKEVSYTVHTLHRVKAGLTGVYTLHRASAGSAVDVVLVASDVAA